MRPYFFKPKAASHTCALMASAINAEDEIFGVTTAAGIRKKIVSFLERFPETSVPANDLVEPPPPIADQEETEEETISLTKAQTLLKIALQSSYLPKLEGKAKTYTRHGLQLEKPLLDRLLRHSKEGLTPMKVLELGCAPLVLQKKIGGRSFVGGSVDAVARVVVDGDEGDAFDSNDSDDDLELIVVEVKARVTASTEQKERRRQGLARLAEANSR
jgi:hypothetical protein